MVEMSLVEAILEVKRAPAHGLPDYDKYSQDKVKQRADAAHYLSKHGTIMELYAGEGNLSEKVYSKLNPRRMVLVDDDEEALNKAQQRLADVRAAKHFYPMNNEKFIKEKAKLFRDTSLVDFDAYGSPGRTIQLFFDNFKVRQPMIVALTDGFPIHIHRWKDPNPGATNGPADTDYIEMYSLKSLPAPSLGEVCEMHDVMMKNIGRRVHFKSWRLNRAFGGQSGRVVYAAYLLRPIAR